ncbi:MAG TPA: hypothetical protein VKP30_02005 [Polyangiaceae bacterium]|nr:hypothetical protein [Polyangiaceae bacterium]
MDELNRADVTWSLLRDLDSSTDVGISGSLDEARFRLEEAADPVASVGPAVPAASGLPPARVELLGQEGGACWETMDILAIAAAEIPP